jgi:peptide/nickel transport system permease protein
MTTYIIRRLLLMIPTLLGITIVVFAISRFAPGDAVSMAWGQTMDGESWTVNPPQSVLWRATNHDSLITNREARMRLYGLDKPVYIQYAGWLRRVVSLDFGDSIRYHRPVIGLVKERLPVTLTLNVIAFVIIYAVSLPVGILAAVKRGRLFDRASSVVFLLLWSLPMFWVGQMLIGFFCGPAFMSWFPPAGLSSNFAERLSFFPWLIDRLWHLVLPVFCLTYTGFAYLTKQVRAAVLDNLQADYVRTARAKGLSESAVILRHVLRNSIIPLVTIMATLLPTMLAGSVIVERIFSVPGMGLLMFEAITSRDYNVVMAVATIAGVLNLAGLLLADIAYAVIDPRISFDNAV